MKNTNESIVTHYIEVLQDDIYVSIGYLSNFIGVSSVRLNSLLKNAEYKRQGQKNKVYPFGKTILFLIECNTFKYSKNLTENGNTIRKMQRKMK